MKKLLLTGSLFLLCTYAFGSPDTLRLFYPVNVHELSDGDKAKIKSIADSIDHMQTVVVKGFADYLDSKAYNQKLSMQRAGEVKAYLLSLNPGFTVGAAGEGRVEFAGKKSALGEPRDRRVEIVFYRLKPVEKPDPAMTVFSNKVDSLSSLDVGKSISLDELTFEGGRHVLNMESEPYLRFLTRYLAEHKNLYFEIRGHICCEAKYKLTGHYKDGRYQYDIADGPDLDTNEGHLSLTRAKVIYEHFVQNGIDPARMSYTGVGASQPKIDPEVTEEDKQKNRRVEIIILKK